MKHTEDKLESLKKKRELVLSRLNARIADEQRKEDSRSRKEETRHKIIVGACLLADMETHPDLRFVLEQAIKRTASARDIEFLKSKGWKL